MKILFITTDWNTPYRQTTGEYGGIGYYRSHKPAEYLKELGYETTVLGADLVGFIDHKDTFNSYVKLFRDFDMVVIKQSDSKNSGKIIGACKHLEIPIVMDLDDNIINISEDNPAYEKGYKEDGVKRAFAIASMSMVDALFVSTQPLKDFYIKFLKDVLKIEMPIYILPNCNDSKDWKGEALREDDVISLGWHGSITHDNDLKLILPVISKLMDKYDNLYLGMIGGIRDSSYEDLFKDFDEEKRKRVGIMPGTPSWKSFPELIMSTRWDIGLAPLTDNEFNVSKSHIKWMEYSMKGIPTIASRVYPYHEPVRGIQTIIDRNTGFLVSTPKEWEETLELLIEDKTLRDEIGQNAKEYVEKNWQYKDNIKFWDEAIKDVVKHFETGE